VEAELLGRVRGLRARVAEVSELHESARALLALAEADTADARERERRLQAEIGQLRERFEFELIRARSAEREPVALPDEVREHIAKLERSEAHLSQRVSALSLQLAAARDLAEGAPFEGRLRALTGEVTGLRFRLDERERALATLRSAAPLAASAPAPVVSVPVPVPVTGNAELEAELTARLRAANDAIDGMRTQLGLKDGLITRLQLELSDNEGVARTSESDAHRLRDENERMREALLAASAAVDERDALQREVETLSKSVVEPSRIYRRWSARATRPRRQPRRPSKSCWQRAARPRSWRRRRTRARRSRPSATCSWAAWRRPSRLVTKRAWRCARRTPSWPARASPVASRAPPPPWASRPRATTTDWTGASPRRVAARPKRPWPPTSSACRPSRASSPGRRR
jgi:predicted  nucleic acid-binding Zn-ribbon protein